MRALPVVAALAATLLAGAVAAQIFSGSDKVHARLAAEKAQPRSTENDELRLRTDEAVAHGLAWLAREQNEKGYWIGDEGHKQEDEYVILHSVEQEQDDGTGHPGVSAFAGMAFLAGGNVPGQGRYGDVVERTVDYLARSCKEDGYITDSESRMYSHAFATLFLAEVFGMERRTNLREKLEMAVELIVKSQNTQGGWRYNPFAVEADLSVTVSQLQALRAARNVGIRVPKTTIDRAIAYVERSRIPRGYRNEGAFFYKIEGRAAKTKTSFTVNAAAVTALSFAGVYDFPAVESAIEYVERSYDEVTRYYPDHFYFWYGNYYAAQAFFQIGGKRWERYYDRVRADLLRRQRDDGSWANSVGPGPVFSTAVACLILQIPKQYLPIFQR
ncbi:MAG: prenyltransferase [Planctomycetes bacterium]|nr:prenyltransferase [Planctomycetota bacterium]MBI3843171.1 prenyltransferase [Planctomycetota bacterium]